MGVGDETVRDETVRDCGLVEAELGLHVLVGDAGAEGEFVGKLPGKGRVEVVDLDLGIGALISLFPVVVIFGGEAERHREAEADPGHVIDLVRNEEVGYGFGLLAAVFVMDGAAVLAVVVEVEADADEAELSLRARVKRHRGRVVVEARDVGAVDTDAGVGAAETESGLLRQLEAAGNGGGGEGGGHGGGSGGADEILMQDLLLVWIGVRDTCRFSGFLCVFSRMRCTP